MIRLVQGSILYHPAEKVVGVVNCKMKTGITCRQSAAKARASSNPCTSPSSTARTGTTNVRSIQREIHATRCMAAVTSPNVDPGMTSIYHNVSAGAPNPRWTPQSTRGIDEPTDSRSRRAKISEDQSAQKSEQADTCARKSPKSCFTQSRLRGDFCRSAHFVALLFGQV